MRVNTGAGRIEVRSVPNNNGTRRVNALLFNFDIDDASLKPAHQQWLDDNIVPHLPAATRIELSGTASRSGSAQYNQGLSQRRVKTVKDYLISKGGAPGKIAEKASGEMPAALAGQRDGSEDPRFRAVEVNLEAPAGTVLRVHVHPIDAMTRKIPSILGPRGKEHFVAVKNDKGVFLTASAIGPAPPANATWEATDELGVPVPIVAPGIGTDPLTVKLPSDVTRKIRLRLLSSGNPLYEGFVWIIFAKIKGTLDTDLNQSDASGLAIGLGVAFNHTISPPSIISLVTDVPDLTGAKVTPLPDGLNYAGKTLQGGANRKWDSSRKIRQKFINPSNIPLSSIGGDPSFNTNFLNFPSTADGDGRPGGAGAIDADLLAIVGNDDAGTGDEDNDPYTAPDLGDLFGSDQPSRGIRHSVGADGATLEWRLHFLEFSRVELAGKWFKISEDFPWRAHIKMKRVGGKWIDDGSIKEFNNSGF